MRSVTDLTLRAPEPEDEDAALRAHAALAREGFGFLYQHETYPPFLAACRRDEAGLDLPPGRVRGTTRFAFAGDALVGRVSVRHELTDFLLQEGGHIGYGVLPEYRRRGYARAMLNWGLDLLASESLDRALVTCDDGNIGSMRTIEQCGGELEDIRDTADGPAKRRYWIELSARSRPA